MKVTDEMVECCFRKLTPAFSEAMAREIVREILTAALSAAPEAVRVKAQQEMKLFGHWSKHRLSDGVFLPLSCYVPEGKDYTTVPLYALATTPKTDREQDIDALHGLAEMVGAKFNPFRQEGK